MLRLTSLDRHTSPNHHITEPPLRHTQASLGCECPCSGPCVCRQRFESKGAIASASTVAAIRFGTFGPFARQSASASSSARSEPRSAVAPAAPRDPAPRPQLAAVFPGPRRRRNEPSPARSDRSPRTRGLLARTRAERDLRRQASSVGRVRVVAAVIVLGQEPQQVFARRHGLASYRAGELGACPHHDVVALA
jgi:hypothetical protein